MFLDKETERRVRYVDSIDRAFNTALTTVIIGSLLAFYMEIISLYL